MDVQVRDCGGCVEVVETIIQNKILGEFEISEDYRSLITDHCSLWSSGSQHLRQHQLSGSVAL